jgi:hypothetical protein
VQEDVRVKTGFAIIVVSFFESVVRDHSKDHPMAVAHIGSDTLTGIRTPLCRTSLILGVTNGIQPTSYSIRVGVARPRPFRRKTGSDLRKRCPRGPGVFPPILSDSGATSVFHRRIHGIRALPSHEGPTLRPAPIVVASIEEVRTREPRSVRARAGREESNPGLLMSEETVHVSLARHDSHWRL